MQWSEPHHHQADMAIGHPCAFARSKMDDPFVAHSVEAYNVLLERKNELFVRGEYVEAWKALVQLREMEKHLEAYCFGGRAGKAD